MKRLTALFLAITMLLCGCTQPQFRSPGTFYYQRIETGYSDENGVIAPEERELATVRDDLQAIADLYCAGPLDPELENPLPRDTKLLEYCISDQVLTLRFNKTLAKLSGVELTLAAGCLARTFLPLTGTEVLILKADGELLGSSPTMTLTLEDLSLRDDSLDLLHTEFPVYYASPDRKFLIRQTVTARHASPEELTMHLLEQLLTPPQGTDLRSALPSGTRFLSATVSNGLCTVDVSQEFDNRRFYAMSARCLSLLSVVNTLTALEEIDRVEFCVEGNPLVHYGSLIISEPLVRDERFIGPVRTGLGEVETTIYLVHGNEGHLVSVPARIRPTVSTTQAELVLRTLLSDSGTNGIRSCISPGTRLLSAKINNGICVVDLSEEYLAQPDQLTGANHVITASLCALDGVKGVQILVNGSVPAGFEAEFSGILTPQDDWFL